MARVIVVDDTPEIREILRLILRIERYEVTEASNGEEALALDYRSEDVMLLDVMMPIRSGLEVLGAFLHREPSDRPRVIMVTAKGSERDRQVAFALGAVGFIAKPFDTDDVLSEVDRVRSAQPSELSSERERQIYLSRMLTLLERTSGAGAAIARPGTPCV